MKTFSSTLDQQILLANVLNDVYPDAQGRFGPFGGRYIPETLVPALNRLEAGVKRYLHDAEFQAEYQAELRDWIGRPTALTHARTLSKTLGSRSVA